MEEGTSIGNYQVTSQIGVGGMGAVYLARHSMLGRPAAVKVLLPELSHNRDIVSRFFNEAKAATAIRHPGIVEIYDFGFLPDQSAYIIMEFLDGESLAGRIKRVGRVPAAHALLLVRQVAGALHAAHEQQIVHRDLKPDNVYIVRDPEIGGGERIKLLDFGIAKLATDAGDSSRTRTGAVMGTPTYMAPEQCRGAGSVDRRADLYALGCILYELLCGRPPFIAEGVGDIIAHHLYFQAEPPRRHEASIPESVEQLVMWLLQKDPAARPATAADVVVAIDGLGIGTRHPSGGMPAMASAIAPGVAANPTTMSGAASQLDARPTTLAVTDGAPRSRRVIPAAAGGLLLVAGTAWLMLRGGDGARPAGPSDPPVASAKQQEAPKVEAPAAKPASAPVAVSPPAPVAEVHADVKLAIESEPAGAEVLFGGNVVGTTPFAETVPWTDAERAYTVRKDGFVTAELTIAGDVDGSERVKLRKKSSTRSPRPPKPTGDAASGGDRGVNPFD